MLVICDTKQPRIACDGDIGTEKIFGFRTMVDDSYMDASAIRVCLRHHDGGMHDLQIANAVGMRLRGARGQ